ncbi:prolyl-tRNA editing enzyme YbaK/EbsC (Cys-tRNA(Pro) deacylase) [Microbacterium ginsengiterrae]|uniref:Prolyl-tRNA editing enzyme YbaK/EbsC (Cys-tRNA(Pro) deacylase) n=1 Tax=Microbacterium ginsengiterrae TaxID=546115 RepID=A0A7W9CE47_9MICO|nr:MULTISPECIES: YbaK/EbsC family protein [Microbacterium]MBB5743948.1 prolyl-tRNA editing enzyme YbaK/EbsC (Cys-tRNA(Pro) deacylase) [Microbacterium ginsengiterrae]
MSETTSLPERSRIVRQHLISAGLDTEIRVLPDSARTAAEAAAAIGCDVAAIANSLVFLADGEPILVMTSGGHRADFGVLATATGAERIEMAPASVVREATGQAIGGVAPVGHPERLRTYIDEALEAFDEIWAAAGHPHTVMPLTFGALKELTDGAVITVA